MGPNVRHGEAALQDAAPIHCYGCGSLNAHGLQVKSYRQGDELVCTWLPRPYHVGHPGFLYGGMIASVVDCHCVWAAMAHAHRMAGADIEGGLLYPYVTASLQIDFRRPVPIGHAIEMRAWVLECHARKTMVQCNVSCEGELCAEARVVAVRMREQSTYTRNAA